LWIGCCDVEKERNNNIEEERDGRRLGCMMGRMKGVKDKKTLISFREQ